MNIRTPSEPRSEEPRRPPETAGTLPGLIAAQSRRTPDAVAVEDAGTPGSRLTYAELALEAEGVARQLTTAGVRESDRVGVCLRRGRALLPALLGVWSVGAAYVPLDPDHPIDRLAWVLEDTDVAAVLTERASRDSLPDMDGLRLLLAGAPDTPSEAASTDVIVRAASEPAYVLHTSGSTGRPKGVIVPHRGIAERVRWLVTRHGIGPGDRFLQKTTIGFDAAGLELFAPLVAGGTVVLAPTGAERDPAVLIKALATERITVFQGVPSVLRALVETPGAQECDALRLVFSAGEPLYAELCHRLLQMAPEAEIWNTYGPTECSVDLTEHRFDPVQTTGQVPIGHPIAGMRALILDEDGAPVSPGEEGELYAAGPGVALGYLGQPGLTAERFVPDSSGPPGTRAYRTGDRVRLGRGGALEYVGRIDQQVKVNGVRVEPAEVEAVLSAHGRVDAAVVDAVPAEPAGFRLVAWLQLRGTAPTTAELRDFVARTLPGPLVPAAFVPLAALPRMPNGKVDRSRLPMPGAARSDTGESEGTRPRTEAERVVAGVWADLLRMPLEAVRVHDDFFQAGGSSLLLALLAVRLRAAGAAVAGPGELFGTATVEAQAALLSAEQSGAGADEPVVPVARPEGGLPLTYGQRGLWLAEQLEPGGTEWLTPQWIALPGDWSEETVRGALQRLATRHEVLRTSYVSTVEGPVQRISPPGGPVPLRSAVAEDPGALASLTAEEVSHGFDLAAGSVWRAVLVRGAACGPGPEQGPEAGSGQGQLLLFLTHHICSDGWSSVVLEQDLRELAAALHEGRDPELPDVPVQFADHAVWMNRHLDAAAIDRELAHWRTVLDGVTPLELIGDRPRVAERNPRGRMVARTLSAELTEALTARGGERGATLHQTLLTAFAAMITRLSGRTDFTVGMPVSGRTRPEIGRTVGFFINTLALRCRTNPSATLLETLESVRDSVLDALAHQEMPLEALVSALESERDLSRTALYQVSFDFHEEGRSGTAVPETGLDALRACPSTARTDLSFVVQRQADDTLLAQVHYPVALFDESSAERFLTYWERILAALAAEPMTPLAEVELLSGVERKQTIALGGRSDSGADRDSCAWTVFEETARRSQRDTALVYGGEEWSYAQLADRAAVLADALHAAGAGPEVPVAVLLPRCPDLVAAILAIWRAGAVYVPLDLNAPEARTGYVLSDAGVSVVLTDSVRAADMPADHGAAPLYLEDVPAGPYEPYGPEEAEAVGALERDPARLAYLIYTSGTTGRPKGVAVEHRALTRSLRSIQGHLRFGEGASDAWLAMAPTTFDIALTELVMPLLTGGRVVLASDDEVHGARALVELIERHEVNHVQAVYPQWRMLVDAGLGDRPLTGQTGGEPCPPALARDLAGRLKRFVNEYGLTETAIAALRWEADSTAPEVALGRPYPHAAAYVLDERMSPVPPHTVGELYVGGAALLRGYAGRPALTAERLVPDPYGPPGSRLFRTGDLARSAPDGTLFFMGRADGQVKIRGRRVETGEVQAVLEEHPGIAEAVVVARGSGDEARLAAYCVPMTGEPLPRPGTLLDHCARSLPEYMLPTYLVRLEALPLTPHRKVDFAALPDPLVGAEGGAEPYKAPEGEVEETLALIWAEVLGDRDAGVHVDTRSEFFRIGGDSLRAARVIARVREEYDIDLPPRTLFDRPTIEAFARAIEDALRAQIAALTDAEVAAASGEDAP